MFFILLFSALLNFKNTLLYILSRLITPNYVFFIDYIISNIEITKIKSKIIKNLVFQNPNLAIVELGKFVLTYFFHNAGV